MQQIQNEDNYICSCMICDKEILPEFPEHPEINNPKDATVFTSVGNYGSSIFDGLGHAYLEVNICDDCMRKAIEKRNILLRATNPYLKSSLEVGGYYVWDGSHEY